MTDNIAASARPSPVNLMAFWTRHKNQCRPIGDIVKDARAGSLPAVRLAENGVSLEVFDESAALAAMCKEPS